MKNKVLSMAIIFLCFSIYYNNAFADNNVESLLEENNALRKENEELKKEIINVKNLLEEAKSKLNNFLAPEIKYNYVEELIANGDLQKAEFLLYEISETYKCSKYEKIAMERAKEVKKLREDKENNEKRLKELRRNGFSKIKQNKNIKTNNIPMSIEDMGVRQKVIYDRNDYEYYYKEADKDSKYISFNFTATSNDKDPNLPTVYLGAVDNDGNLKKISIFDYEFYKWSSYSTYLGNTHDMKNDFAKTKSIKFVAFAQISNDELKNNNIVVFTDKKECISRIERSYGHPPVSYNNYGCDKAPRDINIEDFIKNYELIHIFKKK